MARLNNERQMSGCPKWALSKRRQGNWRLWTPADWCLSVSIQCGAGREGGGKRAELRHAVEQSVDWRGDGDGIGDGVGDSAGAAAAVAATVLLLLLLVMVG